MARVTFHERFDYRPRPGVVVAYKPGSYTVRRDCADQAIAKGVAAEIDPPARAPRRRGKAAS